MFILSHFFYMLCWLSYFHVIQFYVCAFPNDNPQRVRKLAVARTRFMITSLTAHFTRIAVGDCRDGILFYSYHEVSDNALILIWINRGKCRDWMSILYLVFVLLRLFYLNLFFLFSVLCSLWNSCAPSPPFMFFFVTNYFMTFFIWLCWIMIHLLQECL